ncbi:MAG: DUF2752 domain-containing protein [Lacinutrix sp.]|uniref:DUF2752 domain-containing protein n=1 Tax=Lacinutrix sp. TaxID=1937692 RepID=UPI0030A41450
MHKKTIQNIVLSVIILLFTGGIIALYFLYNPSNSNYFSKCIFYSTTGLHCPGCGSQRALHHILQGNILTGLKHNLLLVLLVIILIYKAVLFGLEKYYVKKFKSLLNNSKVIKVILVIIILYWILRNVDYYPFAVFAP